MYSLIDLKLELSQEILLLRSINYIIHSSDFLRYWNTCSNQDQTELIRLVKQKRKSEILKKIKPHADTNMMKLRAKASELKISKYSLMTKDRLAEAINEKENEKAIFL